MAKSGGLWLWVAEALNYSGSDCDQRADIYHGINVFDLSVSDGNAPPRPVIHTVTPRFGPAVNENVATRRFIQRSGRRDIF